MGAGRSVAGIQARHGGRVGSGVAYLFFVDWAFGGHERFGGSCRVGFGGLCRAD